MLINEITDNIKLIDSPIHGVTGTLGTYLVSGEESVIIDPGPTSQTPGVIEALQNLGIERLKAVLLTHIHLDHGGGSWKLLQRYPDAFLYCHPRGAPHMVDPTKLREGAYQLFGDGINEYGTITGVEEQRVVASKDREIIDLGGVNLEVYWTPGHSSHSQCYFEQESRTVIAGDAAGHNLWRDKPIVPTSPPPHNPEQAMQSIELIKSLKPETICLAHFGAYKNPEEHLDRIKDRTELWMRLSLRAFDEGLELNEFISLVLHEDKELFSEIHDLMDTESSLKSSLLGFYMYGKWKKSQN
jgi:glyoxylase-like metal-dependent hydrolase (beta-lactamase superfamily II)